MLFLAKSVVPGSIEHVEFESFLGESVSISLLPRHDDLPSKMGEGKNPRAYNSSPMIKVE